MKKIGYIETHQQSDCCIGIIHTDNKKPPPLYDEIISVWVQQMNNDDVVLEVLYGDEKQIVLADVDESVIVEPNIYIQPDHLHCSLQFGSSEVRIYLADEYILAEIWDLSDKFSEEPIARNHIMWP